MDLVTVTQAASALLPGTLVSERYRIEELLGQGGMGAVFRAEHVHMKKSVALKVLRAELTRLPEIVARFEREAVLAGNIDHPNVAAATDFGRLPDGSFFLVLEYIDGVSLREEIAKGRIDPARALRLMAGIVCGVEAAHAKGIVHRDLKPENVMIVDRGGASVVKVLDFGIAKRGGVAEADLVEAPAPGLTQLGTIIGTPDYMAPEQALGQAASARTDLYSLGVMLYEMLAGHCPFQGAAVTVMRDHIATAPPPLPPDVSAVLPPAIGPLLFKLLEKEPAERLASASELRNALEAALLDCLRPAAISEALVAASPLATADPEPPEASKGTRAPRRLFAAAVVVLAGASAALFFAASHFSRTANAASDSPDASASLATSAQPEPPGEPKLPPDPTSAPAPEASSAPAPEATAMTSATTAPAPKARTGRSAPRTKPAPRKTGPGGIYIPPPSKWFD